uniref:Secreted protein n=1 Tax=Phakopsora pachyrhizi TaxID=170000 RepID=A0A0S1MJ87_PHAPC
MFIRSKALFLLGLNLLISDLFIICTETKARKFQDESEFSRKHQTSQSTESIETDIGKRDDYRFNPWQKNHIALSASRLRTTRGTIVDPCLFDVNCGGKGGGAVRRPI